MRRTLDEISIFICSFLRLDKGHFPENTESVRKRSLRTRTSTEVSKNSCKFRRKVGFDWRQNNTPTPKNPPNLAPFPAFLTPKSSKIHWRPFLDLRSSYFRSILVLIKVTLNESFLARFKPRFSIVKRLGQRRSSPWPRLAHLKNFYKPYGGKLKKFKIKLLCRIWYFNLWMGKKLLFYKVFTINFTFNVFIIPFILLLTPQFFDLCVLWTSWTYELWTSFFLSINRLLYSFISSLIFGSRMVVVILNLSSKCSTDFSIFSFASFIHVRERWLATINSCKASIFWA